jgi:multidrug resistance efflux pump
MVGIVVLLAAAAGAWALTSSRDEDPPLRAAGTLEARAARLGPLVGGRVREVRVEEGETVRAGQPLVVLEPDLLDTQIREQRARLLEARARASLVRSGARAEDRARARVEWEHAEAERRRAEALLGEGIVGRAAYEAAAAGAGSRLELLRALEAGSRPQDVAAAAAAVEREEGRLSWLQRQRDESVVRAVTAGVVQSLDLRPGDLVTAGQGVVTILEPGQLRARVFVPETRLGLVHVGQRVALEVDSHPGRSFPGRVVEIASRGEYVPRNVQTLDQRAEQAFGVRIVAEPAPELKAGMAVLAAFGRE